MIPCPVKWKKPEIFQYWTLESLEGTAIYIPEGLNEGYFRLVPPGQEETHIGVLPVVIFDEGHSVERGSARQAGMVPNGHVRSRGPRDMIFAGWKARVELRRDDLLESVRCPCHKRF